MKKNDLEKLTVLIVDDEPNNIKLLREILKENYEIRVALNGKEALERVAMDPAPALILLDIMMPGMDGYEVCTRLKANPETVHIPVIFVTAMIKVEDEIRGFQSGAVDYIQKPVSAPLVKVRVKNHINLAHQQMSCRNEVKERTIELAANQKAMVYMLGEAGHYNDHDTGLHIWRMAAYARAIAREKGWPVEKASMLELAAPMHDTGKIGIPDSILKAPRALSPQEWEIMKSHTTIGHSILSKSKTPLFDMASDVALCHHEMFNGRGYPRGLSGKEIPESARIVAVADVFDALTTKRPYKEPWPFERAVETIRSESGERFDPEFGEIFLSILDQIKEIGSQWQDKTPENSA